MNYQAEEVRAIARRLHDDITVRDGDALAASDMLTAHADLLERIKVGRPNAWMMICQGYDRPIEFYAEKPEFVPAISELVPLFTHPPAQPADSGRVGDETATVASMRAELVAKIGDCCMGGDPLCTGGCLAEKAAKRNAEREAALAAQGQGEPVAWQYRMLTDEGWGIWRGIEAGHLETVRRRTDCEVRALGVIGGAPPIDLAAVREVIKDIRQCISGDGTTVLKDGEMRSWADKLEAAPEGES